MPKSRVYSDGSYINRPTKFTKTKPKKKKTSTGTVIHTKKKRLGDEGKKKKKLPTSDKKKMIRKKAKKIAQKLSEKEEKPSGIIKELMDLMDKEADSGDDAMEALMTVFKESIEQTNSDKEYFLKKLADMNAIAEAQAEYLRELSEAAAEAASSDGDTEDIDNVLGKADEMMDGFDDLFNILKKTKNRCEEVKKKKEVVSAMNVYVKGYLSKEAKRSTTKRIKK
jgi:methyl-accepting chemotaxis protein